MNFDIYAKDKDGNIINTNGEDSEDNSSGFFLQGFTTEPSNSYFKQLLTDKDGNISKLITEDYDIVEGKWPTKEDELVLFVDSNNKVDIKALYNFGLLPQKEYDSIKEKLDDGQKIELEEKSLNPEDIIGHEFSVVSFSDYYQKDGDKFINIKENEDKRKKVIENGKKVKITAIAKSKDEDADQLVQAPIGYTTKFTDMMINKASESEIVNAQKDKPETDILTNIKFKAPNDEEKQENAKLFLENLDENEKLEVSGYLLNVKPDLAEEMSKTQNSNLTANTNPLLNQGDDSDAKNSSISSPSLIDFFLKDPDKETLLKVYDEYLKDKNYNDNLEAFGLVSKDAPSEIDFYVENFENRQNVKDLINDFNEGAKEDEKVEFTDLVGILTDSIRTIINAITYVLIAFVGVSLVVSSIMIGIITYISVLERTKEIGILRAIGASKKDILKVFMSETFIIGLLSGLIGIGITVLLTIPISKVIQNVTDISYINASLPLNAGVGLIIISVVLTLIAGIIPSRMASKKDPVEALSAE
ncbi:MAG: ABC transporter permease [Anaerococcus sp.]